MRFLLDTNICIYIIKAKPPEVRGRFEDCETGDIGVSAITVAELEFGAAQSKWPDQAREALARFLLPLAMLDFDRAAAEAYGPLPRLAGSPGEADRGQRSADRRTGFGFELDPGQQQHQGICAGPEASGGKLGRDMKAQAAGPWPGPPSPVVGGPAGP